MKKKNLSTTHTHAHNNKQQLGDDTNTQQMEEGDAELLFTWMEEQHHFTCHETIRTITIMAITTATAVTAAATAAATAAPAPAPVAAVTT